MKILSRLFASRRHGNFATTMERARLANTMPGQTAAMQANRLGFLVG